MSDVPASSYDGAVERTADGGVIRFERHLPYAVGDVWDAITSPTRLADWWLPFDAEISVDLREGGQMVFAATGDAPVTMTCTILRVEPPMLLEHTHTDAGSRMRWELEPTAAGCVLRVSHFVIDIDAAIDNCYVVGLHTSLARLAPCLARRPVPWSWDDFARAQSHYGRIGLAAAVDAP